MRISRREVLEVLRVGKRFNSPNFILYVENKGLNGSRFSFSVSKKVCPTAVERNKQRRRGYSVLQDKSLTLNPGFKCFFVFKKGSGKIKFEEIKKEVAELLSLAGVVR